MYLGLRGSIGACVCGRKEGRKGPGSYCLQWMKEQVAERERGKERSEARAEGGRGEGRAGGEGGREGEASLSLSLFLSLSPLSPPAPPCKASGGSIRRGRVPYACGRGEERGGEKRGEGLPSLSLSLSPPLPSSACPPSRPSGRSVVGGRRKEGVRGRKKGGRRKGGRRGAGASCVLFCFGRLRVCVCVWVGVGCVRACVGGGARRRGGGRAGGPKGRRGMQGGRGEREREGARAERGEGRRACQVRASSRSALPSPLRLSPRVPCLCPSLPLPLRSLPLSSSSPHVHTPLHTLPPPRAHTHTQQLGEEARQEETSATWLILPVVICSAQRLSHACLSIRASKPETANGSLQRS